jgi:Ca2+-binding EF-hand superfamily protein
MHVVHSISGRIDFREFLIGLGILNSQADEDRDHVLHLAFKMFDVRNTGRVQLEIIRRACKKHFAFLILAFFFT